jgi:hypothetical protein
LHGLFDVFLAAVDLFIRARFNMIGSDRPSKYSFQLASLSENRFTFFEMCSGATGWTFAAFRLLLKVAGVLIDQGGIGSVEM